MDPPDIFSLNGRGSNCQVKAGALRIVCRACALYVVCDAFSYSMCSKFDCSLIIACLFGPDV